MYDLIRENKRNEKETRYVLSFSCCVHVGHVFFAIISQRKTHNFPQLLKDTLETRNTHVIYLKTQSFPLCPLAGVGQSQMTWKVSHGYWLLVPVSSKYCLTPGSLNLRLVQEEVCAIVRAHVQSSIAHMLVYFCMHIKKVI